MLSIAALRAWLPLMGRGLLWTLALAVFAHLGGATWQLRDGPPLHARWGWSAVAAGAERALETQRRRTRTAASDEKRPCAERPPSGTTEDGRVILNLAKVSDLVRLPGVGEKRALAIVDIRERLGGRFRSLRQLMRVRGIGPRSLKKLRPHLVLDPPEENPKEAPPQRKGDK